MQVDKTSSQAYPSDWLVRPAPLLTRLLKPSLGEAVRRAGIAAGARGRQAGHDDILAQLTLGAWRFLLPNKDPGRQYLWRAALSGAFPFLQRPVGALVADVDSLYRLRNRVAHLESILNLGKANQHVAAIRRVLAEVDPGVEQWYTAQQRVTAVLRNRPR
jgi:hypothetical protein